MLPYQPGVNHPGLPKRWDAADTSMVGLVPGSAAVDEKLDILDEPLLVLCGVVDQSTEGGSLALLRRRESLVT